MKYFIVSFLLISTIIGNIYLGFAIDSHVHSHINLNTHLDADEVYQSFKNFTIYTFVTVLLTALMMLACERRREKRDV